MHLLEKKTINKYTVAIIKDTANFNNITFFLDKDNTSFSIEKIPYIPARSFLTAFTLV